MSDKITINFPRAFNEQEVEGVLKHIITTLPYFKAEYSVFERRKLGDMHEQFDSCEQIPFKARYRNIQGCFIGRFSLGFELKSTEDMLYYAINLNTGVNEIPGDSFFEEYLREVGKLKHNLETYLSSR